MSTTKHILTRRRWLKSLGASASVLPFLPLLESEAGGAELPRRLIVFWTPNGMVRDYYAPSGSGTSFTLNTMMEPFEEPTIREKLLIVQGVDNTTYLELENQPNDHFPGAYMSLTGVPTLDAQTVGGPTFDQVIAQHLSGLTAYDSLCLGVDGRSGGNATFFSGPNAPIAPRNSPRDVLDSVFAGAGTPEGQAELERIRAQQLSILDTVSERLDVLENRVSGADKAKITAHLEAIRAIESRLQNIPSCDEVTLADPDAEDIPTLCRNQIDLMVQAMACDLTRVGMVAFKGAIDNTSYDFAGSPYRHHHLTHNNKASIPAEFTAEDCNLELEKIGRYHAGEVAYLAQRLAEIPEGDGTMLDNTAIVWTSECGMQFGAQTNHDRRDHPFTIIGGGGGFLRTGQVVNYDGRSHCDLFLTLCHMMGMTHLDTFGAPDINEGPLTELIT